MNILRKLTFKRIIGSLALIFIVGISLAFVLSQLSIMLEENKKGNSTTTSGRSSYTNGFEYDCIKFKSGKISSETFEGHSLKVCTNTDTKEVVGVGLDKVVVWSDQAGNKDVGILGKQAIEKLEKSS